MAYSSNSKVKLCDPSECHSLLFCSKQPKLGPAPKDGLPYSYTMPVDTNY